MAQKRLGTKQISFKKDDPWRKLAVGAAQDLIADALNSPVTTIPVLEHTTLDYDGVLTQIEAVEAFGPELDFFNDPSSANADQTQSTFVHPGILQSAIAVVAVGFHVFAEPICFTTIGNSL